MFSRFKNPVKFYFIFKKVLSRKEMPLIAFEKHSDKRSKFLSRTNILRPHGPLKRVQKL